MRLDTAATWPPAPKGARIKTGPLHGIEGWAGKCYGMTNVLPRPDFINQGAAVKMDADSLDLICAGDSILLVKNLSLRFNNSALPEQEQYRLVVP